MALINLPSGRWIDIPALGFAIDYGDEAGIIERNISENRVVELLRENDNDDPYTYNPSNDF